MKSVEIDLLVSEKIFNKHFHAWVIGDEKAPYTCQCGRSLYWVKCGCGEHHTQVRLCKECDKNDSMLGLQQHWNKEMWELPSYSTDTSAALQVIEGMRQHHFNYCVNDTAYGHEGEDHCCFTNIFWYRNLDKDEEGELVEAHAYAESFPMAICLAALKALGIEVPSD